MQRIGTTKVDVLRVLLHLPEQVLGVIPRTTIVFNRSAFSVPVE